MVEALGLWEENKARLAAVTPVQGRCKRSSTPTCRLRLRSWPSLQLMHSRTQSCLAWSPRSRATWPLRCNLQLRQAARVLHVLAQDSFERAVYKPAALSQSGAVAFLCHSESRLVVVSCLCPLVLQAEQLQHSLLAALIPKDKADSRSAVLEVRAGAGGEEAALFAADLLRMYEAFCRTQGWRFEVCAG